MRSGKRIGVMLAGLLALLLSGAGPGPVPLGLILPDAKEHPAERVAVERGAALALADANAGGGYRGRPFRLVQRSVEGLWGAGQNEIARLVFDDRVVGVVGSVDGLGAHVAEQVTTKGKVVLISPWAADPTTTGGNIPWFFRCVPDARAQAALLVGELYQRRRLTRVLLVREDAYDGRQAEAAWRHAIRAARVAPPGVLVARQPAAAVREVQRYRAQAVVLLAAPDRAAALLRALRTAGIRTPVYGSLDLQHPAVARAGAGLPLHLVAPAALDAGFVRTYRARYGAAPPPAAAYTYDAVSMLVAAIRTAGTDRWKVRDALHALALPGGATGPIRFDAKGNRQGGTLRIAPAAP